MLNGSLNLKRIIKFNIMTEILIINITIKNRNHFKIRLNYEYKIFILVQTIFTELHKIRLIDIVLSRT